MFELDYANTIEDVIEFHRFFYKNSPYQQRFNLLIKLVLPSIWIYYEFSHDFSHLLISKILSSIIVILVAWIIFPQIQKYFFDYQVMKHHKKGKYDFFLTDHKLILEEKKFFDITAAQEMEFLWENVERLKEDSQSFYIFFNRRTALIIPKRYFNTQEMISQFKEIVTENIKRSKEVKNA